MDHASFAAYAGVAVGLGGLVFSFIANGKAAEAVASARAANYLASSANQIAADSNRLNIDLFKRQGVIDLHMAWRAVNEIDPKNLVGADVNLAANALDLTSSLWNHDVMEKEILYQSYWASVRHLYETLKNCDEVVPGYTKKGNDFISASVELAYENMKKYHLAKTKTSTIA